MKIAIHIPDINPESGGASSLLKTIQKEIFDLRDESNEYVFLFFGGKKVGKETRFNGFSYFNLDFYHSCLKLRVKNKIKQLLHIPQQPFSSFDAIAKDVGIDLFWFTFPEIVDISYPYIYTLWDLGHRYFPQFPEVSRTAWDWNARESMYQKMLYKASYILTGNEEGKKEILENYPMPECKIRISPFPVADFCRGEEEKPSFEIPEQYFFYPAQFWPHKNHICILEALVCLREKYNLTPTVLLTGSNQGNQKYIEDKIYEYRLHNQIKITGFLKDEELKYLYTHATAMIFASLMGPNNMPPIEATYLNCPVIITDLDGHKEQLGDTSLYFNGYNSEELAQRMLSLLKDRDLRLSIIEKEKKLAVEFDKINYFSCVKKIVDEFSLIRKTWGN